jgi:hypothetical protein
MGLPVPREPQFGAGHLVPRWFQEMFRGADWLRLGRKGRVSAPFSPASGRQWHSERGGARSLPMRTTLKLLAAGVVMLTAAQADAGEFPAPGPLGPRYAPPYGRSDVPLGYPPGVRRSAALLGGPGAPRPRRRHRRRAGRRRPATDPPRRRGPCATAAACSGTGSTTAARCNRSAARGCGTAGCACALRRRARRHRGQFARHYTRGGGGGARRLVRQPRRRAAVPEAAGEVGLPRGSARCANTRIDCRVA